MRSDLCFDAATEGATGGLLSSPTRRLSHSEGPGDPEGYLHPSTPRRLPIYPYPSVMADEDTVLEVAMENLKEAGQRIRATQSLMRSQGMTDGEHYRDLLTRLSTALAMTEAAYLEASGRAEGVDSSGFPQCTGMR